MKFLLTMEECSETQIKPIETCIKRARDTDEATESNGSDLCMNHHFIIELFYRGKCEGKCATVQKRFILHSAFTSQTSSLPPVQLFAAFAVVNKIEKWERRVICNFIRRCFNVPQLNSKKMDERMANNLPQFGAFSIEGFFGFFASPRLIRSADMSIVFDSSGRVFLVVRLRLLARLQNAFA